MNGDHLPADGIWGGILPDWEIRQRGFIKPFVETSGEGVVSFGLGHYGYDMRIGRKFKVFSPVYNALIDPKNFRPDAFVDIDLTPGLHDWRRYFSSGSTIWQCNRCGLSTDKADVISVKCSVEPPNYIIIPPNSFALGVSVEEFDIPRDVLAIVLGKSTYARCGVVVNVTPLEPEWQGKVTIEVSNTTPLPAKIYADEGIAQVVFFKVPCGHECKVSYKDKKGKYQGQNELTLPFVRQA